MKPLSALFLFPLLIPAPLLAQKGLPDDPGEFQTRREALMERLNDGIFLAHSRWALNTVARAWATTGPDFLLLDRSRAANRWRASTGCTKRRDDRLCPAESRNYAGVRRAGHAGR